MKKLSSFLLLLLVVFTAQAQIQEPVKFKTELKTLSGAEAEIVFTGTIDAGWHVYSTDLGDGGPISATFNVEKMSGAEVVGKLTPRGKEVSDFDKLFEMKVRYFEKTAQFIQKIKFTGSDYSIEGYLEYGACNDENCLPPTQVPFKFSGKALMDKYKDPIHIELEETAKKVGGHGGMDFIMDYRLAYCLQNGLPLDMDVYDLAEWCCMAELTRLSIENNSAPVEVPDFTRGGWNKVQGYRHAFAK